MNILTKSGRIFNAARILTRNYVDQQRSDALKQLVTKNKIVVFMKGVPEEPRCGFSNAVVQVLRVWGVEKYDAHDILEDESLRKDMKEFSNWPTFPQVYVDGEFVGGTDILLDLHRSGELGTLLKKAGIEVKSRNE